VTSLRGRLLYHYVRRTLAGRDPLAPLAERRRGLEAISAKAPKPRGVASQPLTVAGRPAEWLHPQGSSVASGRAVLYLHGGAYTAGSLVTHRGLAGRVALASGLPVLLLDYRLAPEHPFPAALEDAQATFAWLLSPEGGCAPGRVAVVGDSAGGGLSLALALKQRDEGLPLPGALACLSPWFDLELAGESATSRAQVDPFFPSPAGLKESAAQYAGAAPLRHPYVSPVHAQLHGLPPMLLQTGDLEILLSDAQTVARRAREAGGEVTLEVEEGMWHVWHALAAYLPEAQRALVRVGRFVQQQLA
jgi:acetyl esterase/lipase